MRIQPLTDGRWHVAWRKLDRAGLKWRRVVYPQYAVHCCEKGAGTKEGSIWHKQKTIAIIDVLSAKKHADDSRQISIVLSNGFKVNVDSFVFKSDERAAPPDKGLAVSRIKAPQGFPQESRQDRRRIPRGEESLKGSIWDPFPASLKESQTRLEGFENNLMIDDDIERVWALSQPPKRNIQRILNL